MDIDSVTRWDWSCWKLRDELESRSEILASTSGELRSVFDPRGGYFKRGGKYMPSLVAEIGDCLENHMKSIGMIEAPEISEHQRKIMDEKRAEFEGKAKPVEKNDSPFPEGAQLCNKCMTKAMILMDGCMTCLNCGESKCG